MYEYKCESCGHQFEEMLPMKDRGVPVGNPCPECKVLKVKQEIRTVPGMAMDTKLKPSNGFKEVVQKIHKNCPGSKIPIDKYT